MPHPTFYLGEICGLLGRLWLREVDIATLKAMHEADFRGLYESLGGFVPTDIAADHVEELAISYCELLIGPKGMSLRFSPCGPRTNYNQKPPHR